MSRGRMLQTQVQLLEHDFAQEKVSALGRLGRALDAALDALARFDAEHAAAPVEHGPSRAALVAGASAALWHFVVQREACGFRDMRQVVRDYRVPAEVAARMGVLPAAAKRPRRPPALERPT